MVVFICGLVVFILSVAGISYLVYDWFKPRWIIFRRQGHSLWEVAFTQEELNRRLDGEMAEIEQPEKPLLIRMWRKLFPLRGINISKSVSKK